MAAAFAGYGLLSTFVDAPRVFGDEIIYMDAADSLADGHGLEVQGHRYGRGPGYPVAVAPILAATQQRSAAYYWTKLLNAFVFALAAVPIYFLARRLLPRRPSALVATLSLAIPSSIYVGLVMTESLAYLVSAVALLAIALALERPTPTRQFASVACIGLACLVRSQFAALLPAYLVALAAVVAFARDGRLSDRLRALWPTASLALVAAAGTAAAVVARGSSLLGDYSDLLRSYSVAGVARWSEYHLADVALYLGLVPVALLPCMLVGVHRYAGAGARARAAFLALFAASNVFVLLMAGAFSSTPFGQSRIHDRYVFYVVPLWLIAATVWLRAGAPRPAKPAALGATLLLAVIASFPFDTYVVDDASKQLHAAGTPIWARLGAWAVAHGQTGHRAIAVVALVAVAFALLLPRRAAWMLALPVAAAFATNAAILWRHSIDDWDQHVFMSRNDTRQHWIDDVVPDDQTVVMLVVSGPHCNGHLPYAYLFSAFFNDQVGHQARLALPTYGGIPSTAVRVGRSRRLVRPSGRVLRARWVVVPEGVELDGAPVARGTRQHLVLWRTNGAVAVDARSTREVETQACRTASTA